MAEKTLNTRIKLRYASYGDWQSSTVKLLPGEVAVCYIEANNSEIKNTAPTVLFKVGDGEHVFSQLQWSSARAADVYNWAKQNALEVSPVGNGNVVSSIEWDASLNDGIGGLKYNTTSVATSGELSTLQGVVDTLNGDLSTLTGRVDAHDGLLSGLRTDVDSKVAQGTYNSKIEEIEGKITTNTNAIAQEIEDRGTAITNAINQEVADRNSAIETAVNTEKGLREAADEALSSRIADYETNKSSFATKVAMEEEQGRVNGLINGIGERIDGVDQTIEGIDGRLGTAEGKLTTLIGDDAGKSARTIAAEELAAQLIPSDAQESLNTLAEIAAWIQEHPEDASAMNEQIQANKAAIEVLNGADTVDGSVAKAVKAETDRAKEAEEANANAIDVLEGYFEDGVAKNAKDAKTLDGKGKDYFAVAEDVDSRLDIIETQLGLGGGGVDESISEQVANLKTRMTTAEGEIDALQEDVGELQETVDTISGNLNTVTGDVNTIKGDYLKASDKEELEGKITAEETRATKAEEALAARVKTIEDDYLKSTDVLILDCGNHQ